MPLQSALAPRILRKAPGRSEALEAAAGRSSGQKPLQSAQALGSFCRAPRRSEAFAERSGELRLQKPLQGVHALLKAGCKVAVWL
eukprot:1844766-Pyramimonas_sp.AAC.1